ncbi:hypothetical protein CLOM_g6512 [Closterium sp. NIES-68]|nr:hypothetical protein CLOM_g6512 [Closterium sp. NIES-68]GJP86632.1 hypothetical protein CLOP_g16632 [Closterium sp. NIES-67]
MAAVVMPIHSYTWVFVFTLLFAFLDGYSIGANDVANSFATSVGSRSLTLKQAVCIAFFTEFGGAIALGATTTKTVKDGIIKTYLFDDRPDLLMTGFMCALIASSTWVMTATYLGLPLSTTHSIIGALIGVGISAYGRGAVNWGWQGKGVAQIATSWILAPCLAGILAAIIYTITLFAVLKRRNSLRAGIWAVPFYFTITIFIVSFYVVSRNGRSSFTIDASSIGGGLEVSGNIGLAFGIIGAITGTVLIFSVGFLVPFFIRRLEKEESLKWYHVFCIHCLPEQPHDPKIDLYLKRAFTPQLLNDADKTELGMPVEDDEESKEEQEEREEREWRRCRNPVVRFLGHVKWLLLRTLYIDVATVQHENRGAVRAHEVAILYDNKTEYLYSLLQVVTASFASFSHGSNDVANALGPLAGVFQIWDSGTFTTNASVPYWMLVNAGLAIDVGLALFSPPHFHPDGYNIMRNLGNNITYHSPSRGFSMELGAALSVITASFLALPVSTTQCIVGATVAVGLCNCNWRAINWGMVAIAGFGWVLTLPVAGIAAGLLYALLTRGPSFTLPSGMEVG